MTHSSIDRDATRIRYAMAVFFALLAFANLAMRERISTQTIRPENRADLPCAPPVSHADAGSNALHAALPSGFL
ncbi:MAG: hypothetical protein R3C58_12770 [Parvularculaceae bacterium]